MITITINPQTPEEIILLSTAMASMLRIRSGDNVAAVEADRAQEAEAPPKPKRVTKPAPASSAEQPAASSTSETSAPTATSPAAPAAETSDEKPKTASFTLEQVRATLADLSQAGKGAQVKELIASYGKAKLTDISKDDYADLMEKAGAL